MALALVALRLSRQFIRSAFGAAVALGIVAVFTASMIGWRALVRRRRTHSGTEYTPEMIAAQFAASGLGPPDFEGDGTVLGASLYAVNQRSKVFEVVTEYEVVDSTGRRLAGVRQVGQSPFKRLLRLFGDFDQFFTHRFEVVDPRGEVVLRVIRPAKSFKSHVFVYDHADDYAGLILQTNVLGKISFEMFDTNNLHVATLRAENWRAWDFSIENGYGLEVARITKSFEGWGRALLTTADIYVVHVRFVLPDSVRRLVTAAALTVDLALKQDSRSLV